VSTQRWKFKTVAGKDHATRITRRALAGVRQREGQEKKHGTVF
jgi:hypothetical protein